MTLFQGPYRWGALFVLISALLHLAAPIVGGFGGMGATLAIIGLIYLGFSYGLARGHRWLAYIVFVVFFIGLSASLGSLTGNGSIPGWIFAGISLANIMALIALFAALWRPAPSATT